ncbi:MAG: ankyrin repeat domain-containing protein [Bacillota bacterium]|nr:ankyrin repeat domain-containing protein [Bacillota bacterium]
MMVFYHPPEHDAEALRQDLLFMAVEDDDVDEMKSLVAQGANARAVDVYGKPLIARAVESNAIGAFGYLIELGLSDSFGELLIKAAGLGHLELVKMLLRLSASPDPRDGGGWTPLMHAALEGETAIAEVLFAHGADVNTTDDTGATALIHAAVFGKVETIAVLLEHGARVDARDREGRTALDWAIENEHSAAVILLREAGTEIG